MLGRLPIKVNRVGIMMWSSRKQLSIVAGPLRMSLEFVLEDVVKLPIE